MRIAAILTMTLLGGISLHAADGKSVPLRSVAVCMHYEGDFAANNLARATASKLFRGIGVALDWAKPGSCPADGIQIALGRNTPETLRPGALAYALPSEGRSIRVFLDRIETARPALAPHLLAYVLVHEITHVIQGISYHSDHGVMKAHWDGRDLDRMQWDELRFDQEDVALIRLGLDKRAEVASAPQPSTQTEVLLNPAAPPRF